ncbi:TonB-linked outer membrane protein, SusC/RagA family [Bacteroidales bacterium Barb6XT]|nr:TonB-linked outer membrane protein, SusC/RagA family [Bacteroidales bacterium Barb6XT]
MKTTIKQTLLFLAVMLFAGTTYPVQAQEEVTFRTYSGIVKDQKSRRVLEYANISVPGTSIGTVTNAEGSFTIKVPDSLQAWEIEISHIGYLNALVPTDGKDLSDLSVWLTPSATLLDEVVIRARDPRYIVEEAMNKIPDNYSKDANLLTGFYRETTRKGRHYINISEAVVDVYKTPYRDRNVTRDRVQIFKGRKLLSQRSSDTLIVKLLGGPNISVFVDIVKNPDVLLDKDMLSGYAFRMEESVMLNDRPHYVIAFTPLVILPYALYEGTLFIDKEKLSFTRAEFHLNMSDREKATQAILKKKPFGLLFRPQEVSFLVTYKERSGLTYLSYIRNEVRFRCDWKRKLFGTNYTVNSEVVITEGKAADSAIPYKASFKSGQSLSDKVVDFYDEDFWGAYNIIEPTESLESAVSKLKKQQP